MEETSIAFHGSPGETALTFALDRAFRDAMALKSKLPDWIMTMPGMSGRKYRRLVNVLVGLVPNAAYMEVGSWAGSTACSAMYGNACRVTCIDNWSEFGGPKDKFKEATDAARSDAIDFNVIESDFRAVDYAALDAFNIYLFDGPHAREDQRDGVVLAQPALTPDYVQIVDDWNWGPVRQGTVEAFVQQGLTLLYGIEVRTTQNDAIAQTAIMENSDWHNGYFIGVMRKR